MGFALSDIELTSSAFQQREDIPRNYTGEGEDISPPLSWSNTPEGARSFALICHDPDAPLVTPGAYGFVHWVLYNIPAETRSLPENIPGELTLMDGSMHGKNSSPRVEYGGPCPPGGMHRYVFKLYALDVDRLPADDKVGFYAEVRKHTIAEAVIMGTYTRQK